MAKSSKGWAWILREADRPTGTDYADLFGGVYTATCPGCGNDVIWNAFDGAPLCDCDEA